MKNSPRIDNTINFNNQQIIPSKIICVGRNYRAHINELDNEIPKELVLFIKPNTALSTRLLANFHEPLHYETELCFLIENKTFVGVGLGLDLTMRSLQNDLKKKGLPWEKAKAFDGAAVFTDFVPLADNMPQLSFELMINNQVVQFGEYSKMRVKPFEILEKTKQFFTLIDGDIIMTGTPQGVGVISKGDVFAVKLFDKDEIIVQKKWVAR